MRVVELAIVEKESHQFGFVALIGGLLGLIGGAVNQLVLALLCTAVLVSLFGAYNQTFKRKNGILGGMGAGGLFGFLVGILSLPISHNINGVLDGVLFGLLSGSIIGGALALLPMPNLMKMIASLPNCSYYLAR